MCASAAWRPFSLLGAAVLACAAVAGSARAADAPPTAEQIVDAINLIAADLPGWTREDPPVYHDQPRESSLRCDGFGHLRRGEATGWSALFTRPRPVEVHSQVWVLATPETAAREVSAVDTARYRRCLDAGAHAGLGRVLHVTRVTVRPLKVHPPSTAGTRLRVGYVRSGRHWISVIDHRWFASGRVVVVLESSTLRMPYPAAKMDALQATLFARAQSVLEPATASPGS